MFFNYYFQELSKCNSAKSNHKMQASENKFNKNGRLRFGKKMQQSTQFDIKD